MLSGAALAQKKVKNVLSAQEIDSAAAKLGYGAVKYFDLKQHPQTNYIFNYDHMLNTKGDTAVYLMFAYARLVSILRKVGDLTVCFSLSGNTLCFDCDMDSNAMDCCS